MLLQHSVIYFIGRFIPALLSLLSLAIFTRLMSTEQYGSYALAITSAGVVSGGFFQWLSISMARFLPDRGNSSSHLISTAVCAYLALVAVSAIVAMIGAQFLGDGPAQKILWPSLLVAWAMAWFEFNQRIANARIAPVLFGVMGSLKAVLALGLGIALFYAGWGAGGVLLGLASGLFMSSLIVSRYWGEFSIVEFKRDVLWRFLRYGAPLTMSYVLIFVVDASDRYFIGWFMGIKAVGTYAPAYDLAQQSVGMLMGIIYLAGYPLALKALAEEGVPAAQRQVRENGLLLLLVSLPATAGLILLADNVASILFGAEFQQHAGPVIGVVAAGVFVAGIRAYYFDYSFQLGQRLLGQVWVFFWAALSNIALNIVLIPGFGLLGAAFATFLSFLMSMLISRYLGGKVFPLLPVHRDAPKVAAAALAMGLALFPLRHWFGVFALAVQVATGMLVYGAALLAFDVAQLRANVARLWGR
ncbi:O-antigen/teichoic acid export membrane protein [Oxalobacteraceae bacterium GrIS 1.11]